MNSVERVKFICKQRKIPISKLEKDLGFSNGYIGQLRKGIFPADRLAQISEYLSCTPEFLLYGSEKENAPAQIESERDKEILENCKDLSEDEMQKVFAYIEGLKANRK